MTVLATCMFVKYVVCVRHLNHSMNICMDGWMHGWMDEYLSRVVYILHVVGIKCILQSYSLFLFSSLLLTYKNC